MNYDQKFSPTVKLQSLRLRIALADYFNLKLHQMDVIAAFLYGFPIYMDMPKGLCPWSPHGLQVFLADLFMV